MDQPAQKNPHAAKLGSLGGKARMADLTQRQRSQLAQKASEARWRAERARKAAEPPDDSPPEPSGGGGKGARARRPRKGPKAGPVSAVGPSVPTGERTILLDKEATVVSVRVQLPDGGIIERGIEDNGTGLRRDVVIRAKLRGLVLVASLACATTAGAGDVDYRLVNRTRRRTDKLAA